jgi:hypothetical protein
LKKVKKIVTKEETLHQLKIDLISTFFSLTDKDLLHFKEVLNFDDYTLMKNKNINWNIKLIKATADKLVIGELWKLKNINIDISFFDEFDDIINYSNIQLSHNILWDKQIVDKYGEKFNWETYLINRENLCNIENIRRFKDKFDWSFVSRMLKYPIDNTFIDEFKDYLDWSKLSLNENLPISLEFLEKYKDKLDFENLSRNPKCIDIILKYPKSKRWNWNNVIINSGLNYNDENFKLVFHYYSKKFPWNSNVNPIYLKIIIHNFLKRIFHFPFTEKEYFLSDKFVEYMPWDVFSKSNAKVNRDFFDRYKSKIDFKENKFLKLNGHLIDRDFISKNINLFNLKSYGFYYLDIDNAIIENNKNEITWLWVASCKNLDWSWDFISDNYENLNFYRLAENENVYNSLITSKLSDDEIYYFLENVNKKD